MNKEEFRNKLDKLNECVKQFEEIKGKIIDTLDSAGNDEIMDCLINAINSLVFNDCGYTSSTVEQIFEEYKNYVCGGNV